MTWRNTVYALFDMIVPYSQKRQQINYWKYVGVFVLLLCSSGGAFLGYRYYVVNREQKAQKIFAECAYEYQKAQQDDTIWPDVVTLCEQGYALHSGAHLAPYFLAYQSEALIKQNKLEEAQKVLGKMVDLLPPSSPLYYLYKIKYLLLSHDITIKELQDGLPNPDGAINLLHDLGHDENNPYRDQALYYVGLYYWSADQLQEAEKAWQDLVVLDTNPEAPSPWAALVKDKLEQLQS